MSQDANARPGIVRAGVPLAEAAGAIILLHGHGGSAQGTVDLGEVIAPQGWALLAPQGESYTWYPYSFLAPRAQNEPFLSSSLAAVASTLETALSAGIPADRVVLAGFSQGACLATEFVGRNPQRYGALLAFTGGLIGPLGEPLELKGDLAGTPVLLSSGDPDPHVPWARVEESGELLAGIGAEVTFKRYPGRPHTVLPAEVEQARAVLKAAKL